VPVLLSTRPQKATSQNGTGVVRNSSSLQVADLDVVKGRHKVRCDLGHFLFGDGLREILFTGLKKRTPVSRRPGLRLGIGTTQPPMAGAASKRVISSVEM
jgi:hypothetical protein